MRSILFPLAAILSALVVALASAQAEPFGYPPAVWRLLDEAQDACRKDEGGTLEVGEGAVRYPDLNGDGRPDAVVDYHFITCPGSRGIFCGTAGCGLDLLIARPRGGYGLIFSGRVIRYDIDAAERSITFRLHGSYCGRAGTDACIRKQGIGAKPFGFTEPKSSRR